MSPTIQLANSTRLSIESFQKEYKAKTGKEVVVQQSHGGSGKQARSVIDGLAADVVTLALAADIDALHTHGDLVPEDWQKRLPDNSCPYTSTINFLVRKGNPKGIKDWDDLDQAGSAGHHSQPQNIRRRSLEFSCGLGLRGPQIRERQGEGVCRRNSTKTCPSLILALAVRPRHLSSVVLGDVLIAWENDALLSLKEFGADKFEIVYPSISILAEPPVSIVDKVVDRKGTREVATAYLEYLYSPEGQEIAAQEFLSTPVAGNRREIQQAISEDRTVYRGRCFSAAGPKRRRPISTTAAFSIRFINHKNSGGNGLPID